MSNDFEREEKQRADLRELAQQQLALEAEAGLTAEMQKAREGNLFPLGIDGEDVSPDAYFADEHDEVRRKVRRAYFELADVEMRKKLIKLEREFSRKQVQHAEADLRAAQSEVARAKAAADRLPWGLAAGVAVACVAIGYYVYALVGAIAGAVGGFFMAQGTIANRKSEVAAALRQAEDAYADLKKAQLVSSLTPEMFNHMEQLTGDEERNFGAEQALWKVQEYERAQKAKSLSDL